MEKEYQVRYILKNLLSELANSEKPDLTPLNSYSEVGFEVVLFSTKLYLSGYLSRVFLES